MIRQFLLFALFASINGQVKVSVYYESLCPDSILFITTQLYPNVDVFDRALTVDLVPWGKASFVNNSGNIEYTCQHGADECYGNRVQACVLDANPVRQSVEFVNCAMAGRHGGDTPTLIECATQAQISWSEVETCLENGNADQLLIANGDRTNSLQPPMSYIPTIIFNDVYSFALQDKGEHDFFHAVCDLLDQAPAICTSTKQH